MFEYMVELPVDALDAEGVLDAVERWHAEQRDREMRTFVAAAHFADLHHPDARGRPGSSVRLVPGMETSRRLGGDGTPQVMEFAAAEFGARLGKSPYAGRMLIADALDVRHRLPRLWAGVSAGRVLVGYARLVAARTRQLSVQAAGWVDGEVAGYADGRLTWSRFETLVEAKVIAADPAAAAERERRAAEAEFAKVGRSNEHGQKTLYVRSAAAAMIRIEATLDYLARALAQLGDTDTEDRRRAKAMLILANPTQALQLLATYHTHLTTGGGVQEPLPDQPPESPEDTEPPEHDRGGSHGGRDAVDSAEASDGDPAGRFLTPFRPDQAPWQTGLPAGLAPRPGTRFGFDPTELLPKVTIYLHLYARLDTPATGSAGTDHATTGGSEVSGVGADGIGSVARWEGQGPISSHYVRELLGPQARFTIKPVLDTAGIAPVDAYEIPDRHREAVHLRSPADVFPFASATTSRDGHTAQLDHTHPYRHTEAAGQPGLLGQTDTANLGPLTRFHHQIKTHGAWQLKQPFPGIYLWRDPQGRLYLVDHTGTRPLGKSPPAHAA